MLIMVTMSSLYVMYKIHKESKPKMNYKVTSENDCLVIYSNKSGNTCIIHRDKLFLLAKNGDLNVYSLTTKEI